MGAIPREDDNTPAEDVSIKRVRAGSKQGQCDSHTDGQHQPPAVKSGGRQPISEFRGTEENTGKTG